MRFIDRALPDDVDDAARLFAALGHPVRLRIVAGLLSGACCVTLMVDCLGLPQSLVSRHLAVLREAGAVGVAREGRQRVYRVIHPLAPRLVAALRANSLEESS